MNRIVDGQIDFLTPFNPRVQTVKVNPESSTDYHGHTKNFFQPRFQIFRSLVVKMGGMRPHSNH